MIRILQDVSHMDRAGIETILMRYYSYMDRSKIQFDFLINKNKEGAYDKQIKEMGGNLYHTPGLNPLKMREYKKYVKSVLKDNPDIKILHAHNDAMEYPALWAAKEIDFPVRISQSHNTSVDFNLKWPIKVFYKQLIPHVATHYFGCGIDAVRYFFGQKTIDAGDYTVIKNAIEPDKFIFNQEIRDKIRKQHNISDKTFLIGHVGRFSNQKNHDFLIESIAQLLIREPFLDFKVVLIGEGELEGKIKNKIKQYHMEDRFILTGSIPNANEYYQALDLFVLPSKYEGLPLVGIEAQTASLPCLFSDKITTELKITELSEFIPLKSEIWVEKILEKFYTKHIRKDMKQEIIDAGYDIQTEAKKLQELYLSLAENPEDSED